MIALGLVGLLAAHVLLYSGFKGTNPKDEIVAAFTGETATKTLDTPTANDPSVAPTPTGPGQAKQPVGPVGARIISTVANHAARPIGNWESDNAVDVVPEPNLGIGSPVRAVESGTIGINFGWNRLGGYRLTLMTPFNDFYYAHFSGYAPLILPGRRVGKGDVIGYMGDTGNAKGTPHVHLGSRVGDPSAYVNSLF